MYNAFIENGKITGAAPNTTKGNALNVEITEEQYAIILGHGLNYYVYENGKVVENPNYAQEQADKRRADFEQEFFNTTLGYIRRNVTMANGSHKDFLSDLLPAIAASIQAGQTVNLIAYDEPDFSHDVTDWTIYQHVVQATAQFVQECFIQLGNDFLPINEE